MYNPRIGNNQPKNKIQHRKQIVSFSRHWRPWHKWRHQMVGRKNCKSGIFNDENGVKNKSVTETYNHLFNTWENSNLIFPQRLQKTLCSLCLCGKYCNKEKITRSTWNIPKFTDYSAPHSHPQSYTIYPKDESCKGRQWKTTPLS